MQYVKMRGTKTSAKRIPRAQGMRLACNETTRGAIFLVPRFKRKKVSLKRPWDVRGGRGSKTKGVLMDDGSVEFTV